jgi:pyrroloquinoline quinone (PQQ) biosynthesis protein C
MRLSTLSFEEWVGAERAHVLGHRGLAHSLFGGLRGYCRDRRFPRAVFREIYHVVLGFPFHIAGAISTTRDEDLLDALARNLYAEVGGHGGERHIEIYKRLLRACGVSVARPDPGDLWAETISLEATCAQLYRSENMGAKLGALFAFELMSSPMVARWDKVLRDVDWLTAHDYEFFTIHIDIESHHADDITNCCSKYWLDPSFRETFDAAAEEVMLRLEKFWDRAEAFGDSLAPLVHTARPPRARL